MLDAPEFPKTGFPEDFLFVVSEVTDSGVDLVILLDMLKSTFPIHWLFSLDLLDLYSKVFYRGILSSLFFMLWEEDCHGLLSLWWIPRIPLLCLIPCKVFFVTNCRFWSMNITISFLGSTSSVLEIGHFFNCWSWVSPLYSEKHVPNFDASEGWFLWKFLDDALDWLRPSQTAPTTTALTEWGPILKGHSSRLNRWRLK